MANVSPYKSSTYMNHFDSQPLVGNYANIYSIVLSLIICMWLRLTLCTVSMLLLLPQEWNNYTGFIKSVNLQMEHTLGRSCNTVHCWTTADGPAKQKTDTVNQTMLWPCWTDIHVQKIKKRQKWLLSVVYGTSSYVFTLSSTI